MNKIFFLVLIFSTPAFATFEVYGGMDVGSYSLSENNAGQNYNHESAFLGHLGLSIGARYMINLGPFGFGVVGDVGWHGDSVDRKLAGSIQSSWYRNEQTHLFTGVSARIGSDNIGLLYDYYPSVRNNITYSDAGNQNPWRNNDVLTGTGYALGFAIWKIHSFALYRRLSYKDVQMAGQAVTLPTARYKSELLIEDVLAGATFSF